MALSVILTSAALCGCNKAGGADRAEAAHEREPLTIWTATDIHYLSPELTDDGELFRKVIADGDAKLTEYSQEIVDEFLREVIEANPDALVLTGDLTFNGEILSLREIAEKLEAVQEAGIPVLVIPGNHDIDSYRAFSYSGNDVAYTDNISKEDFREICWNFGPADALSCAEDSFSYVYALTDDVWLITIDANTKGAGRVTDETLAWAKKQLEKAREEGIEVITATHQSVLPQNKRMVFGFYNIESRGSGGMLRENDVRLNLSGHIHMQHIASDEKQDKTDENSYNIKGAGLTDIATGSMAVAVLRYGIVEIDENRDFIYTMSSVNTLREEARMRFDSRTRAQIDAALFEIEIPDDIRAQMTDFAVDLNFRYFTDELENDFIENNKDNFAIWEKYAGDTFWGSYIASMREQ